MNVLKSSSTFYLAAVSFLFGACKSSESQTETGKPNFVLMVVDDMGWRDLACYGSTYYQTPNIDKLASNGILFTDAYSSCTVCSPTRASIMTGVNPAKLHITDWIEGWKFPYAKLNVPDWTMYLDSTNFTMPRAFKAAGYKTAHIGKWHLGELPQYWPGNHGFDLNIGGWAKGAPNRNEKNGFYGYFSPYGNPRLPDGPDGEYLTERLAIEAEVFINENQNQPFYLNLWFYNVHTPLQAKEEKIEKYQLLNDPEKLQDNPVYAAMVEHVDDAVGRVYEALIKNGLSKNTYIIITSDNGGLTGNRNRPVNNNHPLRSGKGDAYEGGVRVPFIAVGPNIPKGKTSDQLIISEDIFPTISSLLALPVGAVDKKEWTGADLSELFSGKTDYIDRTLIWHYPHYHIQGATPHSTIRKGHYKLIYFYENEHFELYNLSDDIGETMNLTDSQKPVFEELKADLQIQLEEFNAQMPTVNINFNAEKQRAR